MKRFLPFLLSTTLLAECLDAQAVRIIGKDTVTNADTAVKTTNGSVNVYDSALVAALNSNAVSTVGGIPIIASCDLSAVTDGLGHNGTNTCFSTPSASAYSANQTVANSGTAGSVIPMQFQVCRTVGGSGMILRARVKIAADTGFAGQGLVLVLYKNLPTVAAGDHATFSTSESAHLGQIAITLDRHFTDYEKGIGIPTVGTGITFDCGATNGAVPVQGTIIYGLLYASTGFNPQASAKAISVVLEGAGN